jgi:hypothetical protein
MKVYAKRLAVGLFATAPAILRPSANAQSLQWATNPGWTIFVPANDVRLTIAPAHATFATTDAVTVKYDIVNVGYKPMYVPRHMWETRRCGTLHVWMWLEYSDGRFTGNGYGAACAGTNADTLQQSITKDAVLLQPGERHSDTFTLASMMLPPGDYRVEASLYGWKPEDFSDAEQVEMAKMPGRFLRGEVPASARVTLTR